ncbi:MAG: cytochrome P450 [Nocardioides sp.]|uniref:cytochrome P450 n=1 Tax=Nocardioides nematodiphilus TaxID=2849669 RepID=UPI001CD9C08F|nr:cytochrome P450 [Nocardioides nematodiphilus]MCA1984595.1 cytochrome P450 [Nocardioides nematodiphilus]
MTITPTAAAPRLAVTDPSFSITSDEVHAAREQSWYAHTEYGLAILRYEEVSKLMKHPKLRQGSAAWPAHNGVTEGPFAEWFDSWILNKEGEEHHRLRRLLNPAFSPKLIGGLVPRFQALAGELIDAFAERGECDFTAEFAEPYAARVIAIMLGLPESEWQMIARESATLGLALGVTLKQDLPQIEEALAKLYAYADGLIADRSANPRDDFMTTLVQAQRDGDRLSSTELRDAIVLLIFGGYDTTRNQLGLAMQTFMQHPDQWDVLAANPALGGQAVEEVMRVNPTVRWVTREAVETFEYQGLLIEAGTTVHLFSESAGTDPRVFGERSFDIEAERKPHYGFGGGAHHCLGHFVARSDMSEALPLLARRLRNPQPLPGATWLADSGNTGPISLPISFTAAP